MFINKAITGEGASPAAPEWTAGGSQTGIDRGGMAHNGAVKNGGRSR